MVVPEGGDPTNVIGRRAIGAFFEGLIDLLFLYTVMSLLGVKVDNQFGTLVPTSQSSSSAVGVALVAYLVYVVSTKVVTLAFWGWTPGMAMMGLRCVKVDGRSIGLGRAIVRTVFYSIYARFGCLFVISVWLPMWVSKSHKGFQDMLVGSFVIDGIYRGHLLLAQRDGSYIVGPESMTRTEAEQLLRQEARAEVMDPARLAAPPVRPAVESVRPDAESDQPMGARSGEPFFDDELGTYVVWNRRQGAWLSYDQTTNTWARLP